jgi:hypothetical protein
LQKKPRIEKPKKIAPKEKSKSPWSLHIGTFRKLLLIIPSRRLEAVLMGLLSYAGIATWLKILFFPKPVK